MDGESQTRAENTCSSPAASHLCSYQDYTPAKLSKMLVKTIKEGASVASFFKRAESGLTQKHNDGASFSGAEGR